MKSEFVDTFIRSLQRSEISGDVSSLIALFSEDTELRNVEMPVALRGTAGAYRFWRHYLASFQKIRTQFHSVIECEGKVILEWTSEGKLLSGKPFAYEGVTLLDLQDGQIQRLKAYYDSHVFLDPSAKHNNLK